MNCVLIKMGGSGVRFGGMVPKQFYLIGEEPLFAYVLRQYKKIEAIDKYIIVTNKEWLSLTKKHATCILGDKLLDIVIGGSTNVRSTLNGIRCATKYLNNDDVLLVHDVTDPIVNEQAINMAISAAITNKCAAIITEQVHTLYTKDADGYITGTVEKSKVGSGYSPEAFLFEVVSEAFEKASEEELNTMTSAMSVVQAKGIKPMSVVSHQIDLKITYKEDMQTLRLLIENGDKLYLE